MACRPSASLVSAGRSPLGWRGHRRGGHRYPAVAASRTAHCWSPSRSASTARSCSSWVRCGKSGRVSSVARRARYVAATPREPARRREFVDGGVEDARLHAVLVEHVLADGIPGSGSFHDDRHDVAGRLAPPRRRGRGRSLRRLRRASPGSGAPAARRSSMSWSRPPRRAISRAARGSSMR